MEGLNYRQDSTNALLKFAVFFAGATGQSVHERLEADGYSQFH